MEVDVTGNGQAPELAPGPECNDAERAANRHISGEHETQTVLPASSGDDVLESGRYRVFEAPDGGWVVARAAGTCQRCQDCGCGEQQDPIAVPGFVIGMARAQADGGGLLAKVKAAMGRGGGG